MKSDTAGSGVRRPIIKKVRKGGHKHHGGSWKVAYADFVTAMMAFFLLMWLLGSVETQDRAQIANYFKRPLSAVLSGGGQPGGDRLMAQSEGSRSGGLLAPDGAPEEADEARRFARVQEELEEAIAGDPVLRAFSDQLLLELTDQGLRIQLVDKLQRPMFATGRSDLHPYARGLLRLIAGILNDVPNPIIISGHTDAKPYRGGEAGFSNWELSSARANAARRELVSGGIEEGKVLRIEGLASTSLLDTADPYDPTNRRISILLLNRDAEQSYRETDLMDNLLSRTSSE